ncbi:protein EDS1L-like [Rhodamnia argentea]|uniref:Protein EDS1L-like n=1 Tax=Rhodamnia argentea TaxID=178133 RepID=A0A8B8NGA9_9MYRT|nr:protein EDS1L-like [Rhodamnia argentea]
MERDLGIKAEVVKKALSVSIEAHKSPEKPCLVERKIPNSPSHVIVAFPGSWSLNDWFSGDSKAKPFGETKIDTKKFGSLKSIGKEVDAMVNEAFMARFLRILDDGSGTFCAEVTKAAEKDKQIVFAGHSSGSPIAIYATVWFLEEYIRSNKKQTSHPPLCLTFASPLTTDHTFCHAVQREGWSDCFVHFVMKLDIIPRILLAPRSSTTELLQKIPRFLDPHHKADEAKLASIFVNVMKNASCVASYAACALTGSKHTLFDTMSRFIKLSPYRPCGKYVFCTETGKLVVMKNPDAVLQLLFYSLQIESETELQKIAVASLKTHWTYKDALDKSLQNLPELPLSSDDTIDIGASLNDLNLCPTARQCLRAAGVSEKQKVDNQKKSVHKKDAINKALKALDDYRTTSENDGVGYYDAFKMQKKEEDFKANVKRLELAAMWNEIIEMIKQEQLPDKFEAEKEWIELGTRFRRLVEPIDIANYYRHSKNEDAGPYMIKGRPRRYHYPQRWREHAEQLERDSSGESCFWAEVEELNIASTNKKAPWKEIENRVLTLEKNLRKWYDKKEVEKDVFLEKSTLVKWWHTLPDNHKANSCIKELIPS